MLVLANLHKGKASLSFCKILFLNIYKSWETYPDLQGADWCREMDGRLIIRLNQQLIEVIGDEHKLRGVLPANEGISFVVEGQTIWAGGNGTIYRKEIQDDEWQFYGNVNSQFIDLAVSGGCLWVGTSDRLYCSPLGENFAPREVLGLSESEELPPWRGAFSIENHSWIVSSRGILMYDHNTQEIRNVALPQEAIGIIDYAFDEERSLLFVLTDRGVDFMQITP